MNEGAQSRSWKAEEVNDAKNWATTSSLYLFFSPLRLLQTHQSTCVAKCGHLQTAEVITNSVTFSESLEPFPTYVPNSPSLKHWLFLGCAKLVSLNCGFDDWGSQWMSLTCSFNFLSQIFLLIFSLSQESFFEPREALTKTFWHLPRLPDGIKACRVWGVCVCVYVCPLP